MSPRLLVRRPSSRLAEGELTHQQRTPVDADLAQRQWESYVDVFRRHGWEIVEAEPLERHADGVFIEDTVVVVDSVAVLTSPGADSRRGEVDSTRGSMQRLGLRIAEIGRRPESGGGARLDGGDVLKVRDVVYVGLTERTNAEGIAQLAALVEPLGRRVVAVPVTKVLHLKSAVTALPDGTVIGWPPQVDDRHDYASFLEVPEEHGTAVVDLGDGSVVMSADAPRTAELLRDRGLNVETVAITEFEKLEGCVTCLSVRIRD